MDEDLLQRRIYLITFIDSLSTIFSQYKKTCEVLLDYSKIVGEVIKDFVLKSIRNLIRDNIDVYSRGLIAEFLGDGLKFISKL